MKVFISYIDYFATGEGRTIYMQISSHQNELESLDHLRESINRESSPKYSDYFMLGAECSEFSRSIRLLSENLSEGLISSIEEDIKNGDYCVDIFFTRHYNYS